MTGLPTGAVPAPFDRRAVRLHRERAAAGFDAHAFLFREVGDRLLDRLEDVRRTFPLALDLGAHDGWMARMAGGRGGIETMVSADLAPGFARLSPGPTVVADEELLPFAEASFDLVLSNLSLHWVNDLPGALIQARRALKPDGLLLATLFGGETLAELRAVLLEAELAERGGATPRVSPTADVRDAGMLLQRAGFALPVIDTDRLTVSYPDALALMRDLRGMGETSALAERSRAPTPRGVFARAAALYAERHPGRIEAQFDVLFLSGWAPHQSQQKAARRGSGAVGLGEALKGE